MAHQYICFSYSYKRPKCYTSQPKLTIPVYTTIYNYILWYITIFRTGALAACRTHSPRASASTYDTRCRSNYNIVRLVPLASMAPVKVTPGVVAARDVRCRTHTAEKFRTSAKDVNVVARGKRQAIYSTPGGDSSANTLADRNSKSSRRSDAIGRRCSLCSAALLFGAHHTHATGASELDTAADYTMAVNVENGYITVTKGDGVCVRPTVFSGEAQRAHIAKLSRPLRSVRYGSFEENWGAFDEGQRESVAMVTISTFIALVVRLNQINNHKAAMLRRTKDAQ